MSEYQPTSKQEQAIKEYLNEAITPLIEQVLVKKLGQAMSYAAKEFAPPKKEWVGLTLEEIFDSTHGFTRIQKDDWVATDTDIAEFAHIIEARLKEKNG